MESPKLSVLLFQRDGDWIAMSLEHFVAGHGKTVSEAAIKFINDLTGQLWLDADAGLAPLEDTPPAPPEYWERYRNSKIHLTIDLTEWTNNIPPVRQMLGDVRMAA